MENNVLSEQALLVRARKFERQALAEIYDMYSPGLYRYAARLLGDPQTAEECVSETFSRFLHALKDHRGPRDYLQAYLYRIAHNWIVDFFRREKLPEVLADEQPDDGPNPESTAERNIQDSRLRAAIRQLTTEQQQVILLKYMENLDNAMVAHAMKKPVGAIKSLQHRALTRLQQILNEEIS
jgi:RNA polymerase sigma-70 factor (ECF subfamily)